jgi:regulator of protease activity HflC (stomatin/prohibitin superfamily)
VSAALITIAFIVVILVARSVVKLGPMERGVVYRLGKPLNKVIGPGLAFAAPFLDRVTRVSIAEKRIEIPELELITKDGSSSTLSASGRYRILDPVRSVTEIQDLNASLGNVTASILRSIASEVDYDELTSDEVRTAALRRLDEVAESWGAKVLDLKLERRRF